MNSKTHKTVLVAGGTGRLGQLTIAALLQRGAKVRALVRDPAKAQGLAAQGVELVALDVATATPAQLAEAATGTTAVISTLQGGPDIIIDGQLKLLAAARSAGSARFFPSDYSLNFFTLPEGLNINSDWRRQFAQRAAETRGAVEVVHLMQGMFADGAVLGFVGLYDREKNIVRAWGDGNAELDWTTWEDTARYLAAAALDDRPVPAHLFVAGERMSMRAFAALVGTLRPGVTFEALGSLEALQALMEQRRAAEPANMYAWLPLQYAMAMFSGAGLLGALANDRYPDIKPESVKAALMRGAL